MGKTYGYVRVSSKDQCEERQIIINVNIRMSKNCG